MHARARRPCATCKSSRFLRQRLLPPTVRESGARAPLRVTAQYRMQREGGLLCGSFITVYQRCGDFLVFFSVSKLQHPAKLEQRDVINAYAVDGNHGLRIERRSGEEEVFHESEQNDSVRGGLYPLGGGGGSAGLDLFRSSRQPIHRASESDSFFRRYCVYNRALLPGPACMSCEFGLQMNDLPDKQTLGPRTSHGHDRLG